MVMGYRPGLLTDAFFRGAQIREQRERRKMEEKRLKFEQGQLRQRQAAAQETAEAKSERQRQLDEIKAQERRMKLTGLYGQQLQAAQRRGDPAEIQALVEQGRRYQQQGRIEDIGLPAAEAPAMGTAPAAVGQAARMTAQAPLGAISPAAGTMAAAGAAMEIPGTIGANAQEKADVAAAITRATALTESPGPEGKVMQFAQLYPNLQLGTPEFARRFNAWDEGMRKAGASSVVFERGAIGLTPGAQTEEQKNIRQAQTSTQLLGNIESQIQKLPGGYEEFASGWKAVESGAEALATKWAPFYATPEEKQTALGQYETAVSSVGIYRDLKIKHITGAQMSEVETKRLLQSIPTVGDVPWVLKSKIKMWKKLDRVIAEGGLAALREGVQSGKINPQEWRLDDPSVAAPRGRKERRKQQAAAMYRKLLNDGVPPDVAAARVREEF